jgi:hypothetical protein
MMVIVMIPLSWIWFIEFDLIGNKDLK